MVATGERFNFSESKGVKWSWIYVECDLDNYSVLAAFLVDCNNFRGNRNQLRRMPSGFLGGGIERLGGESGKDTGALSNGSRNTMRDPYGRIREKPEKGNMADGKTVISTDARFAKHRARGSGSSQAELLDEIAAQNQELIATIDRLNAHSRMVQKSTKNSLNQTASSSRSLIDFVRVRGDFAFSRRSIDSNLGGCPR